jgi:threonine/homoserine/homoserine lactone efflux protein
MLGLSTLLATSATLFTALKCIGAAYLVYLGIRIWRAPVSSSAIEETLVDARKQQRFHIFVHTYVVTTLNLKSIIFFVAFLPQFFDTSRSIVQQMVTFEVTLSNPC